jgi:outer membrane protein
MNAPAKPRSATLLAGAACLALLALAPRTAAAQPTDAAAVDGRVGKQAGTFMIRGRLLDVFPLNSSSSVSAIGGHVAAGSSIAPEVDFSYFLTDHIALELIAATTRHTVKVKGSVLGDVSVGSVWVLPPALTLQYHFMPREAFSPYVGAGLNYTVFYSAKPAGGAVTKLSFDNNVGGVLQAGFDYNISGHTFLNVDVKQFFLSTTAKVNDGAIKAKTDLNPLVVGVGIGYRF